MKNAMAVTNAGDVRCIEGTPGLTKWLSLYWLATTYGVLTSIWGGIAAILHAPPLFDEMLRLGYPPHFSTLLGVWKVLGAETLSVPRRPLLKEWAYAGMFIDFSEAMVAYASVGEGVSSYIGPIDYDLRDLNVTADGDLALVHSINHVNGTRIDRRVTDLWVRWTVCLRRIDGAWLVAHDYVSSQLI